MTLDLKGNDIEFKPGNEGVKIMWREGTNLRHLNVSCNAFTRRMFFDLFCKAGRSLLETLDTGTMPQQRIRTPS